MKRPTHPQATAHIDSVGIIGVDTPSETPQNPRMAPDDRPTETLPDPWLFDSELLIRELDRCREMLLLIPAKDAATHFAIKIAVDANWNLRETIRYLLALHREGQRAWTKRAIELSKRQNKRNDTPTEVRPVAANRSA